MSRTVTNGARRRRKEAWPSRASFPPVPPHVFALCAAQLFRFPFPVPFPFLSSSRLPRRAPMAARRGFGALEDEACFWDYDSTWEEEEGEGEEEEEEDGGGEGELEAAEAADEEEPRDEGEQSALSWAQGCWQAQVGPGVRGPRGEEAPSDRSAAVPVPPAAAFLPLVLSRGVGTVRVTATLGISSDTCVCG